MRKLLVLPVLALLGALVTPTAASAEPTVAITDSGGEFGDTMPQIDITSASATHQGDRIAFALQVAEWTDPQTWEPSPRGTAIIWRLQTGSVATPGPSYEVWWTATPTGSEVVVRSASLQPLCAAEGRTDQASASFTVVVDATCIGNPGELYFVATMHRERVFSDRAPDQPAGYVGPVTPPGPNAPPPPLLPGAVDRPEVRDIQDACPAGLVPQHGFDDVPADAIHGRAIACGAGYGVVHGDASGLYRPDAAVTREQTATFLVGLIDALHGDLPTALADLFPDDAGSPHEDNINRLAAVGVISGRADGTYGPTAVMDRAQVAAFLVRACEFAIRDLPDANADYFPDDEGSPHEDNINVAAETGFTAGRPDGTYGPLQPVLRGQMASFLARVLDLAVEEGSIGALAA